MCRRASHKRTVGHDRRYDMIPAPTGGGRKVWPPPRAQRPWRSAPSSWMAIRHVGREDGGGPRAPLVARGTRRPRMLNQRASGSCARALQGLMRTPTQRSNVQMLHQQRGRERRTRRCMPHFLRRKNLATADAPLWNSVTLVRLDVQSLPERGSRVVSLLAKAVVCISRETQLRNCYAWQTHRA